MRYTGIAVSAGVVIGNVYLYQGNEPSVDHHPAEDACVETEAYMSACQAAKEELEQLQGRFLQAGDEEKAAIFGAHLEILMDEVMDEEIRDSIQVQQANAYEAVDGVYQSYAAMFEQMDDPIIRERGVDLLDVRKRILRCLAGLPEANLSALPEPVIVVARDLSPSDTATLDREHVLGIVTEIGGSTSHSAIIARSYELPAVLGVSQICSILEPGQEIVLDGVDGVLLTDVTEEQRAAYMAKREEVLRRQAQTKQYLDRVPVTPDGVRVEVELNIASAEPQELTHAKYTDGVGLFRSEFLYIGHSALPTEEEQFEAYRKVLMTFGDRPVILRTLDIGGDKQMDCLELPKEDNPFLGNRALRLCFQYPDMFRTQLRAALRASVYGKLWMMFPMVGSLDDIRRAKEVLHGVQAELDAEGIAYAPDVKIGIMVEIPSIALLADKVAEEVDFASIGTNDLTQYVTAVDRGNPEIRRYYQTYHPALFRLIGYVVQAFSAKNKPVGICGEMGGDPLTAAVLLGLGIRRLSMGAASVAPIKQLVCTMDCAEMQRIAEVVRDLATADEVERYLKEHIQI